MRYIVDNETIAETLKRIGLKPVSNDKSYAGFYKALFKFSSAGTMQWDYLYRGRGYIKNFDEVIKYMPVWMRKELNPKNVNLYDIPFKFGAKPIINHYPNTPCITNKANLLKTLRDSISVLPMTFNLGDKDSASDFDVYRRSPEGIKKHWIYKPEYMYAGKGIQLVNPGPETAGITVLKSGIIQEYEMNPLLLNDRKIDFRVMAMMVGSPKNASIFLSPIPFIRTSGYPFKELGIPRGFDIPNPEYVHITNQSFQKYTSNFGKYEEGNTLVGLAQIPSLELTNQKKQFIEAEFKRIVKLVLTSSLSCIGKGNKPDRFRPFEIFGFDFLVLADGTVKLLEVNDNPLIMDWNNKEANQLGKNMIEEAVLLSLAILEGGTLDSSSLWVKL
jgi:hypothetical protein